MDVGNTIQHKSIQLEESWKSRLINEFNAPYMNELKSFLLQEKQAGKHVFPPGEEIFSAFNTTVFDNVKVVILGQDPYHGDHQAHGLSFSVKPGIAVPPSLRNIYAELKSDVHFNPPQHGFLKQWAEQGVLLLNAVLTVERGMAASHRNRGWERFTDKVIELLAQERENLVFLLWGSYAQKKAAGVDRKKHLVLQAPHPSPLSAHRGFLGCRHFSKTNQYLTESGQEPIQWQLPEAIVH